MKIRSKTDFYNELITNHSVYTLFDKLSEAGFQTYLFGGAVRDILIFKSNIDDYDIICIHKSASTREAVPILQTVVREYSANIGCGYREYPGDHILITNLPEPVTIDVHYPSKLAIHSLIRSDLSINGIAFDMDSKDFFDPLAGIKDLENGKLRLHSPQYVITNPPNYPRLFRVAAKLGLKIEGEFLGLMKTFAHTVTLSDGRPNSRTILEILKFFSLRSATNYIQQFADLKFIDLIFPEISPLHNLIVGGSTQFDLNLNALNRLDGVNLSEQWNNYLYSEIGNHITVAGYLRLISLFWKIGESYSDVWPDSPYKEHVVSEGQLFSDRMQNNLLSHIAARYKESPEVQRIFADLPLIIKIAEVILKGNKIEIDPSDPERGIFIFRLGQLLALSNQQLTSLKLDSDKLKWEL